MEDGCSLSGKSTQSTEAASSREAEHYALVEAAAAVVGFQSLGIDLVTDLKVQLWVDSSAAKSLASRSALRQTKHVAVKSLWVRDALRDGRCTVNKVAGVCNPADILKKPHCANQMTEVLRGISGLLKSKRQESRAADKPRWADMDDQNDTGLEWSASSRLTSTRGFRGRLLENSHSLTCSESAACASYVEYPIPQAMTAEELGPTEGRRADVTVSPCSFSLLFIR